MRLIPVVIAFILVMGALATLVVSQDFTAFYALLWLSMTILFIDATLINRELLRLIRIQSEQVATLLELPQKQQALIDEQLLVIESLRAQLDDLRHVSRN